MNWTADDTWIVAIGAVAGAAVALPGCWLVLTRRAMLPEAIGHGILPGLVVALAVCGPLGGALGPAPLLLGAVIAAALTALLVEALHSTLDVEPGAALGITATTLFALGQVLQRAIAPEVPIDLHHVLFGAWMLAPLDSLELLGQSVPTGLVSLLGVLAGNGAIQWALHKELSVVAFDPQHARMQGVSDRWIRALSLVLTAVTAVAAFQVVGAVLVVSIMVAPPLAARLWTRRLGSMMPLGVFLGAGSVALGHALSVAISGGPWAQGPLELHSAGLAALVAGALAITASLTRRAPG